MTQNVDNLHHKAGSEKIIELHGTSYRVRCLSCSHAIDRYAFQNALTHLNPHFNQEDQTKMIRPDGDVEIDQVIIMVEEPDVRFDHTAVYVCRRRSCRLSGWLRAKGATVS